MNIRPTTARHTESNTASLHIRTAETSADWQLAHTMLDEEHLLGAGREAGDRLCQFILQEDQIVAVLIWCAAAWHLQDRDAMIGWDPVTRSQRLKLVVQLRRFLIVGKSRKPNLASQCLGLALRELPARWHTEHGYRPLVAESFSDPEVSGVCSALRRLLLQPLHRFHSLQIYDTYEVRPPYAPACRCGL